tara:strand:+ start:148 stop:645 length:498 start_codon:yes stop_codon:yes gene_type:complete
MTRPLKVAVAASAVLFISSAQAETISLAASDCQRLVRHVPADDVTYKPGIDVRGKAVAPADLGGGYGIDIPEDIHIDIGIDLADRLGLREDLRSGDDANAPVVRKVLPYEGKAALGLVTIKGGDVFWNGERITSQDEAILAEACRQSLEEVGTILPIDKPEPPQN